MRHPGQSRNDKLQWPSEPPGKDESTLKGRCHCWSPPTHTFLPNFSDPGTAQVFPTHKLFPSFGSNESISWNPGLFHIYSVIDLIVRKWSLLFSFRDIGAHFRLSITKYLQRWMSEKTWNLLEHHLQKTSIEQGEDSLGTEVLGNGCLSGLFWLSMWASFLVLGHPATHRESTCFLLPGIEGVGTRPLLRQLGAHRSVLKLKWQIH